MDMDGKSKKSSLIFILIMFMCLQWYAVRLFHVETGLLLGTLLPGICIFSSAFVLSWAAELAQFYIPQSMAMAFLALVAVVPEYAVDMYFTWTAAKVPEYISYASANMTGGNRLLVGFGWAFIVFFYWLKTRKKEIILDQSHKIEISVLSVATVYSFLLPLKGNLTLLDTFVLLGIFAYYITKISKLGIKEPELENSTVEFISKLKSLPRGIITFALFIFAGFSIFISAKPFAEGLLSIGSATGIDKYILVQWIAPLASESPELITALIFILKGQATSSFRIVISSKINQWTLLVGMLPLVYSISSGKIVPMLLDARQVEELLLTSAQSLFALLIISDMKFSLKEGVILFFLFITQVFFTSTEARLLYACFYLVLSGIMFFKMRKKHG